MASMHVCTRWPSASDKFQESELLMLDMKVNRIASMCSGNCFNPC